MIQNVLLGVKMINTIASERRRLGLSQSELGLKIGRSRSAIGRWESNPSTIDGSDLKKLVRIFGCSVDYLLGISDERTPVMKDR